MDEKLAQTTVYYRYPRQPRAQIGSLVLFDDRGRMLDLSCDPATAEFSYTGHVMEVDESGMLIAFAEGREPPQGR